MYYKKIVLAGGSGCIGTVLAQHFKENCQEIIILSRKAHPPVGNIQTVVWDAENGGHWISAIEGADVLINLTGKSVNCRYTARNKQEILQSRLKAVCALGAAIAQLKEKPRLFITITSATIYRHAEDAPQDEFEGEYGAGFSVDVCKAWEECFFSQAPEVRKLALRMAIVLSLKDGALPRYLNLARYGLGGIQGSGNQMISWIHENEIGRIIHFMYSRTDLRGIFNASAPQPVSNKAFMDLLRFKVGMPIGLPAPRWMLEIGTALMGTETELILKSRWVVPARLLREGYTFRYDTISSALNNLIKNT